MTDAVRNLDVEIARLKAERERQAAAAAASAAAGPPETFEQWCVRQGEVAVRAAGLTLFRNGAMHDGTQSLWFPPPREPEREFARRLRDLREKAVAQLAQTEGHFHALKAAVAGGGSHSLIAAKAGFQWSSAIAHLYGPAPVDQLDRFGQPSAAAALSQIKKFVLAQRKELAAVDAAIEELPETQQNRESAKLWQQAAAERSAVLAEALSVSI